jgi:hypothetical protein
MPHQGSRSVDAMTHPLVRELMAMLPPSDAPFSRQRRQQWVEAANAVLTLVYGDADDSDDAALHDDMASDIAGVVDDDPPDEQSAATSDGMDASESWQPPTAEPYNGSGSNGSGSWSSNGHDIAGRHRRPDFGRLSP